MNDDPNITRTQLEAATAPEHAAGLPHDANCAALRERFLAFGRAVEQASEPFEEQALIARLTAAVRDQSAAAPSVRRAAPSRSTWLLLLSGALAVSALIAIVRVAMLWPAGEQVANVPAAAQPTEQAVAVPSNVVPTPANDPEKLISATGVLTWSDSLDNEIAAAQSRLYQMAGRTPALDSELTGIDQELESLSSDMNGDSL